MLAVVSSGDGSTYNLAVEHTPSNWLPKPSLLLPAVQLPLRPLQLLLEPEVVLQ